MFFLFIYIYIYIPYNYECLTFLLFYIKNDKGLGLKLLR